MTFYERLTSGRGKNPNSSVIRKIFNSDKKSILIGLTKISIDYDILKIEHSGRENHTFQQIDNNLFDAGFDSIEKLKTHFTTLSETGNPNYYYAIKFQV
jgi:hypothetical protein